MQNQRGGRALLQIMPTPSWEERGKSQEAKAAAAVMEKNLNQAAWVCVPWVLPAQSPGSAPPWGTAG